MATISMTYEFETLKGALRFVQRGTSLQLMAALRYDRVVHIVASSEDIQEVHHLAKILQGQAIG